MWLIQIYASVRIGQSFDKWASEADVVEGEVATLSRLSTNDNGVYISGGAE